MQNLFEKITVCLMIGSIPLVLFWVWRKTKSNALIVFSNASELLQGGAYFFNPFLNTCEMKGMYQNNKFLLTYGALKSGAYLEIRCSTVVPEHLKIPWHKIILKYPEIGPGISLCGDELVFIESANWFGKPEYTKEEIKKTLNEMVNAKNLLMNEAVGH